MGWFPKKLIVVSAALRRLKNVLTCVVLVGGLLLANRGAGTGVGWVAVLFLRVVSCSLQYSIRIVRVRPSESHLGSVGTPIVIR